MVYDPRRRGLLDPTGGLIDADVASGLLDVGPRSLAQSNQYTAKWDMGTWNIPQLTDKDSIDRNPRVATNYRNVTYKGDVLGRLDLQADLKPERGSVDRLGNRIDRWGTRSVLNAQPFDMKAPVSTALSSERVLVGRVIPLKPSSDGSINFTRGVNQGDRNRIYKKVQKNIAAGRSPYYKLGKQAKHGPIGQIDRAMTKDQINWIKKNGVELRFNPVNQNAFTDMEGRVVRNIPGGRAVVDGHRVFVVDRNGGTGGVQFYNNASELPQNIRDNIKSGDMKYRFTGGSGGAFTKSPTARIGGGPRRHKTIQEMLADIVN